jgi:hypothetical protein
MHDRNCGQEQVFKKSIKKILKKIRFIRKKIFYLFSNLL